MRQGIVDPTEVEREFESKKIVAVGRRTSQLLADLSTGARQGSVMEKIWLLFALEGRMR